MRYLTLLLFLSNKSPRRCCYCLYAATALQDGAITMHSALSGARSVGGKRHVSEHVSEVSALTFADLDSTADSSLTVH